MWLPQRRRRSELFYENEGEVADDYVPLSLYVVITNGGAVSELIRLFEL